MNELLLLKDIVNIIPLMLEYIVPGFIFLSIRNFAYSKDISKDKYFIIKAIVLSYVFKQTLYEIINPLFMHMSDSKWITTFIFIILIIIVSILYIKLNIEKFIVSILDKGKTVTEDCFEEIIGKDAINIRVYLKDENVIYTGSLTYYDDKFAEDNRKIVISSYLTYDYEGNLIENFGGSESNFVILTLKDIKRIECFKQ